LKDNKKWYKAKENKIFMYKRYNRKIMRILFFFTVKSPISLLFILLCMSLILSYTFSTTYVSSYMTLSGDMKISEQNKYYIIANINKQAMDQAIELKKIIWYTNEQDNHYEAIIEEVKDEKFNNYITVKMNPSSHDVKKEFGDVVELTKKTVKIEIPVKKENLMYRLIDSLLNKKV
jgi:hypothetical protein